MQLLYFPMINWMLNHDNLGLIYTYVHMQLYNPAISILRHPFLHAQVLNNVHALTYLRRYAYMLNKNTQGVKKCEAKKNQ